MVWIYAARAWLTRRLRPQEAQRWRRWKAHDPSATASVDHAAWDGFLGRYLIVGADGINRVRYRDVTRPDRELLAGYLEACAAVPVSALARDEQFAFWMNLYNALTVRTILENYPVSSMRNIGLVPSWLGGGPWDRKRIAVEGEALSLNDIEHRILRRTWRDRRIHYGVNCGALGCPNLLPRAFTGAGVQAALDRAERAFVNDPRGVKFAEGRLTVSKIYRWFAVDFTRAGGSVLDYLRAHAAPELAARLGDHERPDAYAYDWALNEAR